MKAIPTIDAHHHIWRLKDLTLAVGAAGAAHLRAL